MYYYFYFIFYYYYTKIKMLESGTYLPYCLIAKHVLYFSMASSFLADMILFFQRINVRDNNVIKL